MTTVATVTAKTYKAALQADNTCIVSGLQASAIVGGCNTTRALDRQRVLRAQIQAKFYALVQPTPEDPFAGYVWSWHSA